MEEIVLELPHVGELVAFEHALALSLPHVPVALVYFIYFWLSHAPLAVVQISAKGAFVYASIFIF